MRGVSWFPARGSWTPVTDQAQSLMTVLGLVEGDVLWAMEQHRRLTLTELMRIQDWPEAYVAMAAGALIRRGLLQGRHVQEEILLELLHPVAHPQGAQARG